MSQHSERISQWLADLRSGKFKQAREALRVEDGYCCLGVACERFRQDTGQGEWVKDPEDNWQFVVEVEGEAHEEMGTMPPPVVAYFGFADSNPDISRSALEDFENDWYDNPTLAEANDKGLSFTQIAEVAEEEILHKETAS